MFIPLDRDAALPLTRQIASYLEEMIRRGHLGPGAPLPPTRTLARDLRVNRKTVETAYDELRARRLVSMREGQGAVVRKSIPENPELDLPFRSARNRNPFPPEAWCEEPPPAHLATDLAGPGPKVRTVSPAALRRFYRDAVDSAGPLFVPAPPLGEPTLRKATAGFLARCGILRDASEIVIAADRTAALAGILQAFVPRGGQVLAHGWLDPELATAVRQHGARLRRLGERSTWTSRGRSARLVLTTTGAARVPGPPPGLAARKALLDFARERGLPIVEDVTGLDRADGAALPPLASLDESGRVIPICDLSDEVGGDVVAAGLAVTAKLLTRWRSDPLGRSPDRLRQRVLANALESPGRARALRATRERRDLLRAALRRSLRQRIPELAGFEFNETSDALRLDLPPGISGEALRRAAEQRDVHIHSARDCGATPAEDRFVLLDLTRHEEGDLLLGLRELGAAFDQLEEDADSA